MRKVLLLIAIVLIQSWTAYSCVVFRSTLEGRTFTGNNEDSFDNNTLIRFVAATKNSRGCIFWGYQKHSYAQGGINDKGLFWDGTAVPYSNYVRDKNKKEFNGHLFEHILLECESVEEALELLKEFNWEAFPTGNFLLADKSGLSVIIGVGESGSLTYRPDTSAFQALSNFNVFRPGDGGYPDKRYEIVTAMLNKNSSPDINNFRSILSAVHQEFIVQTVYSTICDLNKGIVYLYNFHDYENVRILNISEELSKGDRTMPVKAFFDNNLYSEHIYGRFQREPVSLKMKALINDNKVGEAIELYKELSETNPVYFSYYKYDLGEEVLNKLIDQLIEERQYAPAVSVGELCIANFPGSYTAYEKMGDICIKLKDNKAALDNYQKALVLQPGEQQLKDKIASLTAKDRIPPPLH